MDVDNLQYMKISNYHPRTNHQPNIGVPNMKLDIVTSNEL